MARGVLTPKRCCSQPSRPKQSTTPDLWREPLTVAAFAGRETAIAAMVDYELPTSRKRMLERALTDDHYLTAETAPSRLLQWSVRWSCPVPFNRVMVATFFLTGMDLAHRTIGWFDGINLDLGTHNGHRCRSSRPTDRRRHAGQSTASPA